MPPAAPDPRLDEPDPTAPVAAGRRARGEVPRHTVVLSDLHLADVQPPDPERPLWKRFKYREHVPDPQIERLLRHARELAGGARVELVFNGDAFDFDGIGILPDTPGFPVTWLERQRGLDPEEKKSAWKMRRILEDHPAFVGALRAWLDDGHSIAFVIGNHDLELHWPAVQAEIRRALGAPTADGLRFCEWFLVSGGDTLVTHGNQFDPYCVCPDPLHPYVGKGRRRVRLPFGNLAGRLMLNGMGLFNPHVEDSFIRPLRDYLRFFFRTLVRYQPLIAWTWLWSAGATWWVSVREGLLPAVRDPVTLADREQDAAARARTTPRVVRAMREVAVHPAVFNPWAVARELWLDRALLFTLAFVGAFQLVSAARFVVDVGMWAWGALFLLMLPPVVIYARTVRSEVGKTERNIEVALPTLARIAGVHRVVMGHTHRPKRVTVAAVDYLNPGHWSPAFLDEACTRPYSRSGFVWIRPDARAEGARVAELRELTPEGSVVFVPPEIAPPDGTASLAELPAA